MIWYNKDKTAGLNLSLISYWKCYRGNEIQIYIGAGEPLTFQYPESEEIYNMLTSKKEVI